MTGAFQVKYSSACVWSAGICLMQIFLIRVAKLPQVSLIFIHQQKCDVVYEQS